MGKNRGVCVNKGSGYQATRTSHEPETELLTSNVYRMRVCCGRAPGPPFFTLKSST